MFRHPALDVRPLAIFLMLTAVGVFADDPPTKPDEPKQEPITVVPLDNQPATDDAGKETGRVTLRDLRDAEPADAEAPGDWHNWRHVDDRYRPRMHPYEAYVYDPFGERNYADSYIVIREYERRRSIEERELRKFRRQKKRILNQHERALLSGLRRLGTADYARAAVALTMAAKLNQGDPACRIHLCQTRLALGHYDEAGMVLRRALQLQPKLLYVDMHLGSYYAADKLLDEFTDRLAKHLTTHEARADVHFLLGYLEFQRGNFEAAHAALKRVQKVLPKDDLVRDLLEITKPAAIPAGEMIPATGGGDR